PLSSPPSPSSPPPPPPLLLFLSSSPPSLLPLSSSLLPLFLSSSSPPVSSSSLFLPSPLFTCPFFPFSIPPLPLLSSHHSLSFFVSTLLLPPSSVLFTSFSSFS